MSREKIKDMSMGKKKLKLDGQNIQSTVYFNPDLGYYLMAKGEKKFLNRIGEHKYIVNQPVSTINKQ